MTNTKVDVCSFVHLFPLLYDLINDLYSLRCSGKWEEKFYACLSSRFCFVKRKGKVFIFSFYLFYSFHLFALSPWNANFPFFQRFQWYVFVLWIAIFFSYCRITWIWGLTDRPSDLWINQTWPFVSQNVSYCHTFTTRG